MKLSILGVVAGAVLSCTVTSAASSTPPIIIKGSNLYNSDTKARFFVKGLTYEYAVDDANYANNSQSTIFKTKIAPLGINSVRLYNINPDLSYDSFMADMQSLGIYVMVAGSPGGIKYFGNYAFCVMNRFGTPDLSDANTCYPSCLLEYGKKVVARFAKYDNTLGVIIGNEAMQYNATSAPCIKQYARDLKAWMTTSDGVKSMRTLPLAYAEADTAPASVLKLNASASSNDWATYRNQMFVCGDTYTHGNTEFSLDISMTNIYRWCDDAGGKAGYNLIRNAVLGFPGVNLFGEMDCVPTTGVRLWESLTYLYSSNMSPALSGGFIYTWGAAGLSASLVGQGFPLTTDSSSEITGSPGQATNANYDSLKTALAGLTLPSESGTWSSSKDMCSTFAPTIPTSSNNFNVSCSSIVATMTKLSGTTVTWPIDSREGAVCTSDGASCPVSYPSGYSTTQNSLCGGAAPTSSSNSNTDGGSSSKSSATALATMTPLTLAVSFVAMLFRA